MKEKIYQFLFTFLSIIAKWCLVMKGKVSLSRGKQHFFIEHVMAPDFDKRPHMKTTNAYFKQWGFKVNMLEAAYYQRMTGIASEWYIPYTFLVHYLIPYLNGNERSIDKNDLRRMLGANSPHKKVPFKMAQQVVYNQGGVFYDGNDECVTIDEATRLVMDYDKDIIVKPTTNTTWGKGVIKLGVAEKNEELIRQLFAKYVKDFSFEERVKQHSAMDTLNKSSLNTTRVMTYRKPDGTIKFLFSIQRFGKEGSVIDNASAGGQFVGVSADGTLNRTVKKYKTLETEMLDEQALERIPFFDRIKEAAIYLHGKMPHANYIGWDFSITEEGVPVLIELNLYPAVFGTQIATGPAFSKEDLDELMPLLSRWRIDSRKYPLILFEDKQGHGGKIK